jgi:hypothetical protein
VAQRDADFILEGIRAGADYLRGYRPEFSQSNTLFDVLPSMTIDQDQVKKFMPKVVK